MSMVVSKSKCVFDFDNPYEDYSLMRNVNVVLILGLDRSPL